MIKAYSMLMRTLLASDVKRGQIFEDEDEAEDNLSRPRTSSRPEKAVLNK